MNKHDEINAKEFLQILFGVLAQLLETSTAITGIFLRSYIDSATEGPLLGMSNGYIQRNKTPDIWTRWTEWRVLLV